MPKWDKEDHRRHKEIREREVSKEGEVQAALEKAVKTRLEAGTVPFHTLDGHFRIYSVAHLDLVYGPAYCPSKYVSFYYHDEEGQSDYSGRRARDGKSLLGGNLYLNGSVNCSFEQFLPPLEASSEPFEIKEVGPDSRYTLAFQVIDNDHLIMKASRELVFMDRPKESRGPNTFVFMGIRDDSGRKRLLEILRRAAVRSRNEETSKAAPRRKRKRRERRARQRRRPTRGNTNGIWCIMILEPGL